MKFFYKFKLIIEKYKTNISKIIEFCDENKVNYYELLKLIELRDKGESIPHLDKIKSIGFQEKLNRLSEPQTSIKEQYYQISKLK